MDLARSQSSPAHVRAFLEEHRTGLIALLFTDIVGSVLLKQRLGDAEGVRLVQQHHALLREILQLYPEGQEISTAGDSFLLMFTKPSEAVKYALLVQSRLRGEAAVSEHPVLDRIGIHVGEVFIAEADGHGGRRDLYGMQVDTCSRVMSLACADQILLTRFAFDNARQVLKGRDIESLGELDWLNHGPFAIDGVEEPLEICEVGERGKAFLRPPAPSRHARRVAADDGVVTGWRPAVGQCVPGTQWTLHAKIADGMLGEVWLGCHAELKEQRVFKFCFDAERVRALKREVALFRALKLRGGEHPNIVRLLEVYFDAPPYYIVTEYVEGRDLKSWWAERSSLGDIPLASRLEIVAQAADALQAAHDAGIIHCDVKPSNILISLKEGASGGVVAKLADFGIGHAVSNEGLDDLLMEEPARNPTATSLSSSGTHLYMAPERLAGQAASIRSDIYSLGVVLYQLIVDDLNRPLAVDWTRSVKDDLLRQDLERCFAGNPGERFSSAAELAGNLRSLETRRSKAEARHEEIRRRERAAYRRGIFRTATIAAVAILVVTTLAWLAIQGQHTARLETQRAGLAALQSQRRLERLNVAYGVRLMEEKDLLSAYQRSVSAWRIADSIGDPAGIHRVRAASLLRHSPRLLQFWSFGDDVRNLDFSPDGRRLATAHTRSGARVWDTATGLELIAFPETQRVEFATFDPKGDRIMTVGPASGTTRWEVRLWDARTGRAAGPTRRFETELTTAMFLEGGDQILVTTGGGDIQVWDAASGRPVTAFRPHSQAILDADVSPDGAMIAAAREDGTVALLRLDTGEAVCAPFPPLQHGAKTLRAVFSPDAGGTNLLTSGEASVARIWDTRTGKLRHELPHQPGTWLTDAAFSPDGRRVLTTSWDATARIWDAETGRPVCQPIRHQHSVMRGQFSHDGRRVLTACFDQAARLWDAETGEVVASPLRHSGYVHLAQFDPEGRRVASVGGDRTVRLWDLAAEEPARPALEHRAAVNCLAFSHDGLWLASGSADLTARVWDLETRRPLSRPLVHEHPVTLVSFQPDGRLLLTLQTDPSEGENAPALLWDVLSTNASGPQPRRLEVTGTALHAAFSADGRRVLVVTKSNLVAVFDPATALPAATPWRLDATVFSAAFNPAGDRVALGLANGHAAVFDALSGRQISPWLTNATTVWNLEFSGDGRRLATASSDGSFDPQLARVWDAVTGGPVTGPLPHFDGVRQAVFSPGQDRLGTASEDGTAALWSLPSGELAAPYLRHGYQVTRITFSQDGRMVATASRDRTARVWEAATGEPITPPLRHADRVNAAVFSPDDAWLATGGGDGLVRFWDLRPATLSLSQCVAMALLLNSRQLEVEGGPVPARREDLRRAWAALKNEVPHRFVAGEDAIGSWHFNEFQSAAQVEAWESALEHLNWLVTHARQAWPLHWHRANTCTNLARWQEAIEDYARVTELDPGSDDVSRLRDGIIARGAADPTPEPRRPGTDFPSNANPNPRTTP